MVSFGRWIADRLPEKMTTAYALRRLLDDEENEQEMWTGVSKKRQEKIRRAVEQEVKESLVEELTPVIRDQVRQEIEEKALAKARKQAQREVVEGQPTARQREAFRNYVREVEVDAHAQATVASNKADRAERGLRWSRRFWGMLSTLYMMVLGPALFAAHRFLQAQLFHLLMTFLVALVLWVILLGVRSSRTGKAEESIKASRKVSSDYLRIADQAKSFRIVHAERIESKDKLGKLVEDLERQKSQLDTNHHVRVEDLYEAADSVRSRVELDADKYRIYDDFDERLEEIQAESEASEAQA